MQTGENEQALRKIADMSRFISITLLVLHFYFYCYGGFVSWGLTVPFTDKLIWHIGNTGLFAKFNYSKYWAVLFLLISLMGVKGKKDDKISFKPAIAYLITGVILYFFSNLLWDKNPDSNLISILYMAMTVAGFLLIISGATLLTRVIKSKLKDDIFNADHETFPQEERHLENEYSINLPAKYLTERKVSQKLGQYYQPFQREFGKL